jgi:hypothetical protein
MQACRYDEWVPGQMRAVPRAAHFLTGLKGVAHAQIPELFRRHATRSAEAAVAAPPVRLLPERAFILAAVLAISLLTCPLLLFEFHRCV